MRILQGIPVSPGVAIGEALIIDVEGFRIPRRFVTRDVVEFELARLDRALAAVGEEIERNRDAVSEQIGKQYGAIFSAHLEMLRDPKLHGELRQLVGTRNYSPEYAVSRTLRKYAKVFQDLADGYLAERAQDIFDIERSLLRNLLGRPRGGLSNLTSPAIVLAHNLTPSETAGLDRQFVLGFATEVGGVSGHTAIVAKGLEIPAIVGIGAFLADVAGGELVIVDGHQGRIVLQPDEEALAYYRHEAEQSRSIAVRLDALRDLPAETTDGVRVQILANIEFPHEVTACRARGADGIGLYRTEFLYLGAEQEPDEQTHYDAYAQVVQALPKLPVTLRTVDLGADKLGRGARFEEEANPSLGLRSIRLSLRDLPMFRVQLRAVLRASALGPLHLMFPLITTLQELRQAKMIVADVMEDLEEAGIPFCRDIPIGMMVEVPAAVVMLDRFLQEVDFISLGTNDLVQYTLAVDRGNNHVAHLYRCTEPAVLRLIEQTIRLANAANVPVTVCGQMSGTLEHVLLLLGFGLRSLSVPPSSIPEVKKLIRSATIAHCESIARRALELDSALEIDRYLRDEISRLVPELSPGHQEGPGGE